MQAVINLSTRCNSCCNDCSDRCDNGCRDYISQCIQYISRYSDFDPMTASQLLNINIYKVVRRRIQGGMVAVMSTFYANMCVSSGHISIKDEGNK